MTYMRSWKNHRLTSHTWLGLNPQIGRPLSRIVAIGLYMYVSESMTFITPHVGHSRYGLFFTRLDCQSTAKPSEKYHDLPRIRTWDLWSTSQHTQPLKHLGRLQGDEKAG
jgi:hypothetical protein